VSDVQTRVYDWIDHMAAGELELERLQLVHLNAAEQAQQLSSYRLEGADLGDIKGDIWRTARHVVAAWSQGPQRFALRAYVAGAEESAAYLPFLLAGEQESSSPPGSSEPANMVGLLKQLMRHTEAQQRTIQVMSLDALTFQQRALRSAQTAEEHMRARYYELMERSQVQLADQEERAMARELTMRQEERKDQLAARAMTAVPLLANQLSRKLGGPALFEQQGSTEHMMLSDMLAGLDDQRFEMLLGAFPDPAHRAFLLQRIKETIEARKATEETQSDDQDPDPSRH